MEERLEQALPERLRAASVAALPQATRPGAEFARQTAYIEAKHNRERGMLKDYRQAIRDKYRNRPP